MDRAGEREFAVAVTEPRTDLSHVIRLTFPAETLPDYKRPLEAPREFRKAFSASVLEKTLLGRNRETYPLDIVLLDPRISRLQCEIYFDTIRQKFVLRNCTRSEIYVNTGYIRQHEEKVLEFSSFFVFDRLTKGKENRLDYIRFDVDDIYVNPDPLVRHYTVCLREREARLAASPIEAQS